MIRRALCNKGQDLVEYALILPILLMLILGTADLATVVFAYDTLGNAAREAARYGIIHPTDHAGITARGLGLTSGLDQSALNFAIAYPGSNTIQVNATYDAPLATGFLIQAAGGNTTLRLQTSSTMQIE